MIKDFRIFALVCVLLGGMGQGVVAPKLPALLGDSADLATQSGLSAALMYLGIFVSSGWYGRRADCGQVHSVLTLGLAGYALSLFALAFSSGSVGIFSARFLEGLSLSGVYVASDFILGRLSAPKVRAKWLSYYGVALSVGLLLGPALALAFSSPYPPIFLVAGLSLVLGLVSIRIRVQVANEEDRQKPRLNFAALASASAYGYMESALVALFPVLAVREFHVLPEKCLIAAILSAAISSIAWGELASRFGSRKLVVLLLLLLALGPIALGLSLYAIQPGVNAYLSSIFFGVLAGGLYPVGFTWLLESLPESAYGYASGNYARAYGLGSLIGPLAAGVAATHWGARGLFATMAMAGIVGFVSTLRIKARNS